MKDDLISRSDFVEQLMRVIIGSPVDPNCAEVALVALRECRTVDAVEVVRCKDCQMSALWRKPTDKVIGDCMLRKWHTDDEDFIQVGAEDFCSHGVRREDND